MAATLRDNLKAKYSGIVLDVAWGLFELRLHRDPTADPNALWTDLASRYLHVKPHPELSWWARRGQLVDSPGYMMNYALGAILVADMRERSRTQRGAMSREDRGYYRWLSEHLYRFGLERTSGDVIRRFLGRAPSPKALLADMRRAVAQPAHP
jgi:Zn-dependent M32 family carboxypeptidase